MGDDHHPWEFPCFRSLEGNFQQVSDAFPRTHARIDGLVALRELTFMMETVSAKGVRGAVGLLEDTNFQRSTHAFPPRGSYSFFVRSFLVPWLVGHLHTLHSHDVWIPIDDHIHPVSLRTGPSAVPRRSPIPSWFASLMRTKWAKWVRWECHGRGHVGGYLEIKSWASKVIVGMPANKTGRSLNLSRERPDFLCRTKARSAISPEDSKVRYKACEAFINVAKVIRSGILEDMGAVFHGLCRQVRGLQVTCHEIFFFGNVYCCLYRYTCTCANYIYTSHIYIYTYV